MRITGGKARGILLQVPERGEVRPATDAIREKIFSRIGENIQGCTILDGFAGTGAYGLEALSRGASFCLFLEKDIQVLPSLKKNISNVCKSACLESQQVCRCVQTDAFNFTGEKDLSFDYIFLDPPYRYWEGKFDILFNWLDTLKSFWPQAMLVLEYPSQLVWPSNSLWQPVRPVEHRSKQKNAPGINLFR